MIKILLKEANIKVCLLLYYWILNFQEINTYHSYLEIAEENIVAQCVVISILNIVTETNNIRDKCCYYLDF